ncbi:unnamed protein product [Amoebophrya sp. A120]|nr:unnamed protein product [Amoebophrya sp. A120]|eukprot:GSA120T00001491001.1
MLVATSCATSRSETPTLSTTSGWRWGSPPSRTTGDSAQTEGGGRVLSAGGAAGEQEARSTTEKNAANGHRERDDQEEHGATGQETINTTYYKERPAANHVEEDKDREDAPSRATHRELELVVVRDDPGPEDAAPAAGAPGASSSRRQLSHPSPGLAEPRREGRERSQDMTLLRYDAWLGLNPDEDVGTFRASRVLLSTVTRQKGKPNYIKLLSFVVEQAKKYLEVIKEAHKNHAPEVAAKLRRAYSVHLALGPVVSAAWTGDANRRSTAGRALETQTGGVLEQRQTRPSRRIGWRTNFQQSTGVRSWGAFFYEHAVPELRREGYYLQETERPAAPKIHADEAGEEVEGGLDPDVLVGTDVLVAGGAGEEQETINTQSTERTRRAGSREAAAKWHGRAAAAARSAGTTFANATVPVEVDVKNTEVNDPDAFIFK